METTPKTAKEIVDLHRQYTFKLLENAMTTSVDDISPEMVVAISENMHMVLEGAKMFS